MATPKKPRIIVTKDEVKASDIAHDHVQALVPDGMVLCSMQDKTAAREDQDNDISWNDDIGTIATSLTDDEAATLRKKTGVLDVEDDEMMFALSDDGSPFDDDDTGFGSMAFEDDVFTTSAGWQFYVVGVSNDIFKGTFGMKIWVE